MGGWAYCPQTLGPGELFEIKMLEPEMEGSVLLPESASGELKWYLTICQYDVHYRDRGWGGIKSRRTLEKPHASRSVTLNNCCTCVAFLVWVENVDQGSTQHRQRQLMETEVCWPRVEMSNKGRVFITGRTLSLTSGCSWNLVLYPIISVLQRAFCCADTFPFFQPPKAFDGFYG